MEADLSALGLKDLKRRARALGAPAETIEDLDDAADPKAAAIDLIVQLIPAAAPESEPSGDQEDLTALSVKELKRRARGLGATDEAIEDLDDADDVRGATIALIRKLSKERQSSNADLRPELEALSVKELKKRARALGATEETIEDLDDVDDVKAAAIELIVQTHASSGGGSAHEVVEKQTRELAEAAMVAQEAVAAAAKEIGLTTKMTRPDGSVSAGIYGLICPEPELQPDHTTAPIASKNGSDPGPRTPDPSLVTCQKRADLLEPEPESESEPQPQPQPQPESDPELKRDVMLHGVPPASVSQISEGQPPKLLGSPRPAYGNLVNKFCSDPFQHAEFRRFEESNYFHHVLDQLQPEYDAARPPEQSLLWQQFIDAVEIRFDTSVPHSDPEKEVQRSRALQLMAGLSETDSKAMLLWTMDERLNLPEVFNDVNKALLCDDPVSLGKLGYFVAGLNRYIAKHPVEQQITLLRGTKIKDGQRVAVEEHAGHAGQVFRQPLFCAASPDEDVVTEFCSGSSPVMEFRVPAGCTHCTRVPSELSAYPQENEYLLAPYAPIRWVEQRERMLGGHLRLVVTFDVLDDVEEEQLERSGCEVRSCLIMCKPVKSLMRTFRGSVRSSDSRAVGDTIYARALVIGIKAYDRDPLKNTVHDATDLSASLESLGFDVTLITDNTQTSKVTIELLDEAVKNFVQSVDQSTVAVFAFMGHGAESSGRHYLVPQDFGGEAKGLVRNALNQQQVLKQIEAKQPLLALAILDCCREKVDGQRGFFGGGGLGSAQAPVGTHVLYATGEGQMAHDGDGRNGVFTETLLQHIGEPGLTLNDLAIRVAEEVKDKTSGNQVPEQLNRTTCNVCLVAAPTVVQPVRKSMDERMAELDASQAQTRAQSIEWVRLKGPADPLEVCSEASTLITTVPCSLSFVSIFGAARAGKSTLMSFLAGIPNVFEANPGSDSYTKGINISSKILSLQEFSSARGAPALEPSDGLIRVAFADAEGQGDMGNQYDIKLVAGTLVVSRVILFNWASTFQKHEILDKLAVMTEVAKKLRDPTGSEKPFGHLHVVFQNCRRSVMEDGPDVLLCKLIDPEVDDGFDPAVAGRNQIRRMLRASFESICCQLMPEPVDDKEKYEVSAQKHLLFEDLTAEYRASLEQMRASIANQLQIPRTLGGAALDGGSLARLMQEMATKMTADGHLDSFVPASVYQDMQEKQRREEERLAEKAEIAALREAHIAAHIAAGKKEQALQQQLQREREQAEREREQAEAEAAREKQAAKEEMARQLSETKLHLEEEMAQRDPEFYARRQAQRAEEESARQHREEIARQHQEEIALAEAEVAQKMAAEEAAKLDTKSAQKAKTDTEAAAKRAAQEKAVALSEAQCFTLGTMVKVADPASMRKQYPVAEQMGKVIGYDEGREVNQQHARVLLLGGVGSFAVDSLVEVSSEELVAVEQEACATMSHALSSVAEIKAVTIEGHPTDECNGIYTRVTADPSATPHFEKCTRQSMIKGSHRTPGMHLFYHPASKSWCIGDCFAASNAIEYFAPKRSWHLSPTGHLPNRNCLWHYGHGRQVAEGGPSINTMWTDIQLTVTVVTTSDYSDLNMARLAAYIRPVWVTDDRVTECMLCSTAFETGIFGRLGGQGRHHCRYCGWLICAKCTPKNSQISTDRWVSSTSGHQIKFAAESFHSKRETKQVCTQCAKLAPTLILLREQRQAPLTSWSIEHAWYVEQQQAAPAEDARQKEASAKLVEERGAFQTDIEHLKTQIVLANEVQIQAVNQRKLAEVAARFVKASELSLVDARERLAQQVDASSQTHGARGEDILRLDISGFPQLEVDSEALGYSLPLNSFNGSYTVNVGATDTTKHRVWHRVGPSVAASSARMPGRFGTYLPPPAFKLDNASTRTLDGIFIRQHDGSYRVDSSSSHTLTYHASRKGQPMWVFRHSDGDGLEAPAETEAYPPLGPWTGYDTDDYVGGGYWSCHAGVQLGKYCESDGSCHTLRLAAGTDVPLPQGVFTVSGCTVSEINGTYVVDTAKDGGALNGKPCYRKDAAGSAGGEPTVNFSNGSWYMCMNHSGSWYKVSSSADLPPANGWITGANGIGSPPQLVFYATSFATNTGLITGAPTARAPRSRHRYFFQNQQLNRWVFTSEPPSQTTRVWAHTTREFLGDVGTPLGKALDFEYRTSKSDAWQNANLCIKMSTCALGFDLGRDRQSNVGIGSSLLSDAVLESALRSAKEKLAGDRKYEALLQKFIESSGLDRTEAEQRLKLHELDHDKALAALQKERADRKHYAQVSGFTLEESARRLAECDLDLERAVRKLQDTRRYAKETGRTELAAEEHIKSEYAGNVDNALQKLADIRAYAQESGLSEQEAGSTLDAEFNGDLSEARGMLAQIRQYAVDNGVDEAQAKRELALDAKLQTLGWTHAARRATIAAGWTFFTAKAAKDAGWQESAVLAATQARCTDRAACAMAKNAHGSWGTESVKAVVRAEFSEEIIMAIIAQALSAPALRVLVDCSTAACSKKTLLRRINALAIMVKHCSLKPTCELVLQAGWDISTIQALCRKSRSQHEHQHWITTVLDGGFTEAVVMAMVNRDWTADQIAAEYKPDVCRRGHSLVLGPINQRCDECQSYLQSVDAWRCTACDYDRCKSCAAKARSDLELRVHLGVAVSAQQKAQVRAATESKRLAEEARALAQEEAERQEREQAEAEAALAAHAPEPEPEAVEECEPPARSVESAQLAPTAPTPAPAPAPTTAPAPVPTPAPAPTPVAAGAVYACKRKSVIRASFEMDSEKAGVLEKGEIITALEMRLNAKGVCRVRFDRGWTSINALAITSIYQLDLDLTDKLPFIASGSWVGNRDGYEFKKGDQGVGYYTTA